MALGVCTPRIDFLTEGASKKKKQKTKTPQWRQVKSPTVQLKPNPTKCWILQQNWKHVQPVLTEDRISLKTIYSEITPFSRGSEMWCQRSLSLIWLEEERLPPCLLCRGQLHPVTEWADENNQFDWVNRTILADQMSEQGAKCRTWSTLFWVNFLYLRLK